MLCPRKMPESARCARSPKLLFREKLMEEILVEKRQQVVDVAIAGRSQVIIMLSDFWKDAWADAISVFFPCKSKPLETGEAFWEILLPSWRIFIAFWWARQHVFFHPFLFVSWFCMRVACSAFLLLLFRWPSCAWGSERSLQHSNAKHSGRQRPTHT